MREVLPVLFPAIALALAAAPLLAQSTNGARSRPAARVTLAPSPAPRPADVVKSRIAGLRELGAAFKNVSDGLRGEPQIILLQQSARQVKNASTAMNGWFPAGTGPQPGVKTLAKPEIWTRAAEFQTAKVNFARAADALQTAVASGNANAIKGAFRQVGGACKGCHDPFRTPPPD